MPTNLNPCEHPTTTLDDRWEWVLCTLCDEPVKYNPAKDAPMGHCSTSDRKAA